jgi:enamine deaminase RidA (YjgF/YER057c/UK114 family)
MREQAALAMDNLKKTLEAAGCSMKDLVSATRYLTDVREQDDLNRVWAERLGGHLPTTTTVEVSRLATHANCKIEISAIAVAEAAPATGSRTPPRPRRSRSTRNPKRTR